MSKALGLKITGSVLVIPAALASIWILSATHHNDTPPAKSLTPPKTPAVPLTPAQMSPALTSCLQKLPAEDADRIRAQTRNQWKDCMGRFNQLNPPLPQPHVTFKSVENYREYKMPDGTIALFTDPTDQTRHCIGRVDGDFKCYPNPTVVVDIRRAFDVTAYNVPTTHGPKVKIEKFDDPANPALSCLMYSQVICNTKPTIQPK